MVLSFSTQPSLSDTVTAFLNPSSLPAHSITTIDVTADLDLHDTAETDPYDTTTELHDAATRDPHDPAITHHSSSSKDKTEKHSDDATSLSTTTDNFSVMDEMHGMRYHPVHRPSLSADTSYSFVDTHSSERRSDITSLSTENSYSVMRDKVSSI